MSNKDIEIFFFLNIIYIQNGGKTMRTFKIGQHRISIDYGGEIFFDKKSTHIKTWKHEIKYSNSKSGKEIRQLSGLNIHEVLFVSGYIDKKDFKNISEHDLKILQVKKMDFFINQEKHSFRNNSTKSKTETSSSHSKSYGCSM